MMLKYGLAFFTLLSCYGAGALNKENLLIFYGEESLEQATANNFSSQNEDDDPYNFEVLHFESLSIDSEEDSFYEYEDDSFDLNLDLNAEEIPEHCKIVLQAKEARAQKYERDLRKDKPYRSAYNMLLGDDENAAMLTKEEHRAIFKEAQRNELKNKVSLHRAINSAKQNEASRQSEKNKEALKIMRKNDYKERRALANYTLLEVIFDEGVDSVDLITSKGRAAILADKRLQDARCFKPHVIKKKENIKINAPSIVTKAKAPKEAILEAPALQTKNLFLFTPSGWL